MLSLRARSLGRFASPRGPASRSCGRGFASSGQSETKVPRLADESILDHLVCPISKYPLRYDSTRGLIICPEIRVAYPVVDGIPMLVPAEGRVLRDDEEA